MLSHESLLSYKPPLPKMQSSKYDAPHVDPSALPSVDMNAKLLQVSLIDVL
jgi:hypothetical protein